jgi:hypothetical protein
VAKRHFCATAIKKERADPTSFHHFRSFVKFSNDCPNRYEMGAARREPERPAAKF